MDLLKKMESCSEIFDNFQFENNIFYKKKNLFSESKIKFLRILEFVKNNEILH